VAVAAAVERLLLPVIRLLPVVEAVGLIMPRISVGLSNHLIRMWLEPVAQPGILLGPPMVGLAGLHRLIRLLS
jgi:hypothetical protein